MMRREPIHQPGPATARGFPATRGAKKKHAQWDVEHLLASIARVEDGLAHDLLNALSVDRARLRADADNRNRRPRPSSATTWSSSPSLPRIVQLLERANVEAERLNDEYVGVEHLLIAITGDSGGPAAQILRSHQITSERLYAALRDIRGSPPRGPARRRVALRLAQNRYATDLTRARVPRASSIR